MVDEKTVPELIANRIKRYNSKLLFQRRDGWSWKQITWLDFEREVKSVASFLMDLGFGRGDASLLVSSNRVESISTEIAVWSIGGVTIPIAENEALENIARIVNQFKVKFIFAGKEFALDEIQEIYKELRALERIVCFADVNGAVKVDKIIPFRAVLKFGSIKRKQLEDELVKISKNVSPDCLATIFNSSSSNGNQNSDEITQGDLIQLLRSTSDKLSFIGEEDQSFSYLPSASPFDKLINHFGIFKGARIVIAETREDFYEDILEVKPTVVFETKIGLETICSRISCKIGTAPSSEKLKTDLGSRVKYVATDSSPGEEIKSLFSKSGISLVEVPELNRLIERPK